MFCKIYGSLEEEEEGLGQLWKDENQGKKISLAEIATVGEAMGEQKWSQEVFSMGWCNHADEYQNTSFFTERKNILEKLFAYKLSSVEENKTT